MQCDWRDLTWWEYTARLYAWNAAHDPKSNMPEPNKDRLRKLMTVH